MHGQMQVFSAALRQAVRDGAANIEQKVRRAVPTARLAFSGPTEVTSFQLPDHGPVFDIRVPGLSGNQAWAIATLLRQPPEILQQMFQGQKQGQSQGASVNRTALTGDPSAGAAAPPPAPAPFVDPALMRDPDEWYTLEVQTAIIEAMVENSQALHIAPNSWLTVVARDSAEPDQQSPSPQTELHNVIFQIKGSDLSDYHAKRIAPEDVRKRVKITED
jgi:hypothetical protein